MSEREKAVLKAAKELLKAMVGEEAPAIIDILLEYGEMEDNEIAEKLGLRINAVRRTLYRMMELGFVRLESVQEESKVIPTQKWSTSISRIVAALERRKRLTLERLMNKLKELEKEGTVFVCRKCKVKLTLDEAFEENFVCPNCGEMLESVDSSEIAAVLEKIIERVKNVKIA